MSLEERLLRAKRDTAESDGDGMLLRATGGGEREGREVECNAQC